MNRSWDRKGWVDIVRKRLVDGVKGDIHETTRNGQREKLGDLIDLVVAMGK